MNNDIYEFNMFSFLFELFFVFICECIYLKEINRDNTLLIIFQTKMKTIK